jgi:error-prone DNA polymerase
MRKNNLPEEFAQRVYQQIEGFGEYGFPESHAASFAVLVYVSAWLKHHYPAVFAAALINSQPMGFYQPAQLVRDARDHGVAVRGVDVNWSRWDCTLERQALLESRQPPALPGVNVILRLGLCMLNGIGESVGKTIECARESGPFLSVDDFTRRTRLGRAIVKRLAEADAFGSIGAGRRQAMWQALGQEKKQLAMPLFDICSGEGEAPAELRVRAGNGSAGASPSHASGVLPVMEPYEEVVADYRTAGLSLRAHPISFYRAQLDQLGVTPSQRLVELENDAPVIVAGLVLLRQRPGTAKGITFVTLEDETGTVNLVVHQHMWDRYYRIARRAPAWIVHGRIQTVKEKYSSVIHVVVNRLEALAEQLWQLDVKTRDFR